MITKHYSLVRADNILNMLMNDRNFNRATKDLDIIVECYQNGREQGYQLVCWKLSTSTDDKTSLFIAQERHSDQVVVMIGSYGFQSVPEKAYKNSKCFNSDDEAFEFIKEIYLKLAESLKTQEEVK
jgi:hypothetical protein